MHDVTQDHSWLLPAINEYPTLKIMKTMLPAFALGTLLTGCSILPSNTASLALVQTISSTSSLAQIEAKAAPDSAKDDYTALETSFNGFIDLKTAYVETIGQSSLVWEKVDFSDTTFPPDTQAALAKFTADLPATANFRVADVHTAITGADAISIIFKVVGAIQDDRKTQADTFKAQLNLYKLPDWNKVRP